MSPLAHPKGKTPSRSCNLRKGVFLRLAACQSLSLWEQRRRPPPVAETGRSCWGRGQQDASGSEADAGSRNPGSVTEGDGEGKPGRKEPLRSDRQALCQSDAIAVQELFISGLALSVGLAPASSPRGGAIGRPGNFPLDAESPTGRKRAGLAYGDSGFWTTHLVKLPLA